MTVKVADGVVEADHAVLAKEAIKRASLKRLQALLMYLPMPVKEADYELLDLMKKRIRELTPRRRKHGR